MTTPPPTRRPGGPTLDLLLDVLAQARHRRSWAVPLLLLAVVLAVLAAWFGQTVVPWTIYPLL